MGRMAVLLTISFEYDLCMQVYHIQYSSKILILRFLPKKGISKKKFPINCIVHLKKDFDSFCRIGTMDPCVLLGQRRR